MAYGSPETNSEVMEYLAGIYHGRPVPDYAVQENTRKYAMFGGKSPSNGIVNSIRGKLAGRLRGEASVWLGNKHWKPWLQNVVSEMVTSGIEEITAIPLFPFASHNIEQSYLSPILEAIDRLERKASINLVNGFSGERRFIDSWAGIVEPILGGLDNPLVVFTAHSLPVDSASEDRYVRSLERAAGEIAGRVELENFITAFQSRGKYGRKWLEPSVETAVRQTAGSPGDVLVVPVGFCYEHLEVLYDLDVEVRESVESMGHHYHRSPLPNDDDNFVSMLAEVAGYE